MTRLAALLLSALFLLSVISWIGDVYDWGLQSLYSAEGIRWAVAHALTNLRGAPLTEVMLSAVCLGLTAESGFLSALAALCRPLPLGRRTRAPRLTLKQRRALQLAALAALALLGLALWLTLFPPYVLLSAFGTLRGSAFLQGLPALLCLVCISLGMVYGGLSGRFQTFAHVLDAASAWPARLASCFVVMLIVAELLSCLDYVVLSLAQLPRLRHLIHLVAYATPLCVMLHSQRAAARKQ